MQASRRYLIVTPCRDEAQFARRTLDSVCGQTVPPALWVIVDDGSSDDTPIILAEYERRVPFLRVVRRTDRGRRSVGPGVIDAFYAGYQTVHPQQFDYVCKLDLDLELPPDYFERLMRRMEADPRLGHCSGKAWYHEPVGGELAMEVTGDEMSVGAAKFFRRECFEQIGGFVREVMWDGIDGHRARMLGWKVRSWDEPALRFLHLRPMGSSQGSLFSGRMRHGFGQYFMGTGFVYITISSLYRMAKAPLLIGGLATWWGYVRSWLRHLPRYPDPEFRTHLRRYQWMALRMGKMAAAERLEDENSARWNPHAILPPTRAVQTIDLEGVPFAAVTEQQAVEYVVDGLNGGRGGWVIPINTDVLRRWTRDPEVRALCGEADLFLADGMPLLWAAKLRGRQLPARVAGSTLLVTLSGAAAASGHSIFLLGGDEGTAEAAAESLQSKFPGLRVAGTYCPPIGFERDNRQMDHMRQSIAASRPDIVFVGLGFPKQERLIAILRPLASKAWWMGVGISFSFVSGRVRRAPVWMQRCGLEWAHRMVQDPRRLFRRYVIDDMPYAAGLLCRSLVDRGKETKCRV